MTARATPYPQAGFGVRVPESLWSAALDEVRRYAGLSGPRGSRGSEGLVYLGGVPTADALVVTSLFRLHHEPQGDCVKPTPDQVRWLLSELRRRDEKLVAQLHTHRHGARHSVGDDQMAASFHDGFLSIVVPRFAAGVEGIDQCVVHEYRDAAFRPLPAAETTARFTLYPQVADRPCQQRKPGPWDRFARKLKQTVRVRPWRARA